MTEEKERRRGRRRRRRSGTPTFDKLNFLFINFTFVMEEESGGDWWARGRLVIARMIFKRRCNNVEPTEVGTLASLYF